VAAALLTGRAPYVQSVTAPRWFTVRYPRLLGGEHPCPGGDARVHRARLAHLHTLDVTTFVDLTEYGRENGIAPYRTRLRGAVRAGLPMSYHSFPIRDAGVPQSTAQAEAILDVIDVALMNNERVYVHCRSGVGRTGTVLALHLVRHGCSPREALRLVQAAWRRDPRSTQWTHCPQTDGQRRYVLQAGA
jgi:atypical dual specificity phosphatase